MNSPICSVQKIKKTGCNCIRFQPIESQRVAKEKAIRFVWLFCWQPEKDSNPHKQSQSLSCYLYTIRLSMLASQTDRKYYTIGFAAKSSFYPNFFNFFRSVRRGGCRRGIGRVFSVHTTIPAASADAGPARLPVPRRKRCVTVRKSQILTVLYLYIALFLMIKQVEKPLKKQYNNICTKIFR